MLHTESEAVRRLLLTGSFGLEKESLRVCGDGSMAHTPHPFPDDDHITRDFCENQTEINTPVTHSPEEAVASLDFHYKRIQEKLRNRGELLWPFSNPAYIRGEDDIPVARFEGGGPLRRNTGNICQTDTGGTK